MEPKVVAKKQNTAYQTSTKPKTGTTAKTSTSAKPSTTVKNNPKPTTTASSAKTQTKKGIDRKNIDVDSMVEKYKNCPSKAIDSLGLNLRPLQQKILKKYVKDENSLRIFLNYLKQDKLSYDDIIAGIKKSIKLKEKSFMEKAQSIWSTFWDEGLSAAYERTKSDRVYESNKIGKKMNTIRRHRRDISSDGVATLANDSIKSKQASQAVDHFTTKRNTDGSYLYNEKDCVKGVQNVAKRVSKEAQTYMSHVVELENIKDSNGNTKYKGATIIDGADKATDHPTVAKTIIKTALKKDMNDTCFMKITDNLCKNESMQEAIEYSLNAKRPDGSDRFSAQNISDESDYLVDKNEDKCNAYTKGLKQLSKNENLSGSDIVEINNMANDNPGCREEIYRIASNPKSNSEDIKNDCRNYIEANTKNNSSSKGSTTVTGSIGGSSSTGSTSGGSNFTTTNSTYQLNTPSNTNTNTNTNITTNNTTNPIKASNLSNTKTSNPDLEATVTFNGTKYKRSVILQQLSIKYGANAEIVLQRLEQDQSFIELMKKYGDNKVLRNALVEDPQIITKLKKISCTLTTSDLAEIIPFCKNPKAIDALRMLSDMLDPHVAITYLKDPSRTNNILEVLQNTALSREMKLNAIKQLTGK